MMKVKLARWVLLVSSILMISSCSVMKSHYGRGWTCHWTKLQRHANVEDIQTGREWAHQNELQCSDEVQSEIRDIDLGIDVTSYEKFASTAVKPNCAEKDVAMNVMQGHVKTEVFNEIMPRKQENKKHEVLISERRRHSPEDKWLLFLLAVFLPPLTVYLLDDSDTNGLITSILLTVLGCWIAGVVYSIVKVARKYS